MGVRVIFVNPSIRHVAENIHPNWRFRDAIQFHRKLGNYYIHTNEGVIVGREKAGSIQMDPDMPFWIILNN